MEARRWPQALTIVVLSYRQTIYAYPHGGSSYVVSRENLGQVPSLVAGASILVDYVLTVAVSISAGVAAIVSLPAFRDWNDHRVLIGLVLIGLITLANLRGMKESGTLFAVPTYTYIVALAALIGVDVARFGDDKSALYFRHGRDGDHDPDQPRQQLVVGAAVEEVVDRLLRAAGRVAARDRVPRLPDREHGRCGQQRRHPLGHRERQHLPEQRPCPLIDHSPDRLPVHAPHSTCHGMDAGSRTRSWMTPEASPQYT